MTTVRFPSALRTGLISATMLGYAVLLASPASAAPPEGEVADEPPAEGPKPVGNADTDAAVADDPAPAKVDKKSLPWRYRVGIVADTKLESRKDIPWIKRWAPERLMFEIGIFGGMHFPSEHHDYYDPEIGYKPLWLAAGGLGGRIAFFPERYIGIEAEGAGFLTRVRTTTNDPAALWAARGHVIAQLPLWNVVPFVLVGGGGIGVKSHPLVLGSDIDPAIHWGGGVKLYLHRYVALRVEGRHVLAARQATQNSFTSHAEFLAGLTVTLGRAKPLPEPPPDPDRDKDGFINERDDCPDTPGVSPDGCPPRDSDKDGFVDTEDACPYEAGIEPDGCPIRDKDGDGIPDPIDVCIDRPETHNGFEDEDGCPDDLPPEVHIFNGVIEGIEFAHDSTEITEGTKPVLDRAIKVLTDYPDLRIQIIGHTDNEGTAEYNIELSQGRADSVKAYMTAGGVDDSRIETLGVGKKDPIASNETEEGRAKNRRIEFKILKAERAPE